MKFIPLDSVSPFKLEGITSYETVGKDTGARFLRVTGVNIEPGISMNPHRHENSEQTHFIIEGEGEITVDNQIAKVKKKRYRFDIS